MKLCKLDKLGAANLSETKCMEVNARFGPYCNCGCLLLISMKTRPLTKYIVTRPPRRLTRMSTINYADHRFGIRHLYKHDLNITCRLNGVDNIMCSASLSPNNSGE
jgi:hypothetical protein